MMLFTHKVAPNTLKSTDAGLNVGYGQTACLEFDKVGHFSFVCATHFFVGTIVVE